jgi:hypothetical protein
MARRCSICTHAQRTEIEIDLINSGTFRDVAGRYGVSVSAVHRHKKQGHLASGLLQLPLQNSGSAREAFELRTADQAGQTMEVSAAVQGKIEKDGGRARDVMVELERCFSRANLLFEACDRWLRDPEDPDRYDLNPRAEDVFITFSEQDGEGNVRVRRKKRLSLLLEEVKGMRVGVGVEILTVETKSADPRKLVLDAIAELRQLTALQLSIFETLNSIRDVTEFQSEVLDCIAETAPEIREVILDRLQARRRVCSIVDIVR